MRGTSHCWAPYTSHRLLLTEAFCVHGTSAICTSEISMVLAKRVSSGDQRVSAVLLGDGCNALAVM